MVTITWSIIKTTLGYGAEITQLWKNGLNVANAYYFFTNSYIGVGNYFMRKRNPWAYW